MPLQFVSPFSYVQIGSVTRQLQCRTEASGWAVSAACSHHPTARVGHSRGIFAIRTSYVGRRQYVTRTYVDHGRISTELRTSILATGRASTAGTIITLTWVFMANHVEETTDRGQRGDPGSSPAWRRCPVLANLRCIETRWKKDMGGPLRTTGIACGPAS